MPTDFPFVVVPPELLPVIGERDGDSRVYRKRGPAEDSGLWYEIVSRFAGPSVSPGGVIMYCPVSRAAIYKRMQDGNLTAFNYYPTGKKTRYFGGLFVEREMPYCYIPISEAKAWRKELEERALARGKTTHAELDEARRRGQLAYNLLEGLNADEFEGKKPDPDGRMLEWDSKWQKEQRKKKGRAK